MKKILIVLLALACLFGAVSCKDTVDKLYKAQPLNYYESEENFVLTQIIQSYIGTVFTLQNKETTTVYKSLEGAATNIDGKLISEYIVEDGEPKYSFTFKGTFEDAKNLNVSFDVDPTDDDFPIIPNSVKNLPDAIKEDFLSFFQNPLYGSGSPSVLQNEACGFVDSDYAESSTGKSVSVIEANEILVSAPLPSASDEPYEDYDGETITLLKDSKVTTEFKTDRSDLINSRSVTCVEAPLTSLASAGKTNDTFKIDAKYKVEKGSSESTKSIKATVRLLINYEGSCCTNTCNAGIMLINFNGKEYILPIGPILYIMAE